MEMKNFPHSKEHQALIALLKRLRLDAGVKQEELAKKLNRPQSYVSKYETGERRLDFVDVYLICEALDVSFVEFVEGYEDVFGK